jgi:hypothetical protein
MEAQEGEGGMKAETKPLAVLRIVAQRDGCADCAISALATFLGKGYEHVLIAAGRVSNGRVMDTGLHGTEIERTAKALGFRLRRIPWDLVDEDEDDDLGMLYVKGRFHGEKYEEHVVVYRHGPDGPEVVDCREPSIWPFDLYMTHYAATPTTLLVVT